MTPRIQIEGDRHVSCPNRIVPFDHQAQRGDPLVQMRNCFRMTQIHESTLQERHRRVAEENALLKEQEGSNK